MLSNVTNVERLAELATMLTMIYSMGQKMPINHRGNIILHFFLKIFLYLLFIDILEEFGKRIFQLLCRDSYFDQKKKMFSLFCSLNLVESLGPITLIISDIEILNPNQINKS